MEKCEIVDQKIGLLFIVIKINIYYDLKYIGVIEITDFTRKHNKGNTVVKTILSLNLKY
jgi:hypothetical protein